MENHSITALSVGRFRFKLAYIYRLPPDHAFAGHVADVPVFTYHIALPNRSVLVDATSYDVADTPPFMLIPGYAPPPTLLEQLAAQGIDAGKITDVVITHAHHDHYKAIRAKVDGGYVPAFPQARHYLGRADWQMAGAAENPAFGLVERHGLLDLVDGVAEIGDGMTILPMPGETPGHQILGLATGEQTIYFGGDLFHHEVEFADPSRNVFWAAREAMQASKAAFLRRLANSDDLAYFTHIVGPHRVVGQPDGAFQWRGVEAGG